MAITLAAARIGALLGNVVFGYLVEVHCAVPIIMVAALLIGRLCHKNADLSKTLL